MTAEVLPTRLARNFAKSIHIVLADILGYFLSASKLRRKSSTSDSYAQGVNVTCDDVVGGYPILGFASLDMVQPSENAGGRCHKERCCVPVVIQFRHLNFIRCFKQ